MLETQVSLIGVVVAAVASMIAGFLWYSPALFGKKWASLKGFKMKTKEDMKKMQEKAKPAYIGSFAAALVTAWILSQFLILTQATTLMAAATTAFWIWFGFIATTMFAMHLFSEQSKELYLIDVGHQLVSLIVMAEVLVLL